jgi:hypothetical protein
VYTDFLRTAGFRRIGHTPYLALAADPNHPSHLLLDLDDPEPPYDEDDEATALEAFEAEIEDKRVRLVIFNEVGHRSDDFRGFPDSVVDKLIALRDIDQPTADLKLRLKYGCTCGQCIGGFLSPRMRLSVHTKAQECHGILSTMLHTSIPAVIFVEGAKAYMKYIDSDMEDRLKASISLFASFVDIFADFATALDDELVPREAAIRSAASSDWQNESCRFVGSTILEMS